MEKDRIEIFVKLLKKLVDGMKIVFTPNNIAEDDDFLIFGSWRKQIVCTFKRRYDGVWKVYFDGGEPMLLEDCPTNFYKSILLNIVE